jgi:hypothetical protein
LNDLLQDVEVVVNDDINVGNVVEDSEVKKLKIVMNAVVEGNDKNLMIVVDVVIDGVVDDDVVVVNDDDDDDC